MYSFLLPFFPTGLGFWGEFLTRHTHGIKLAKGECCKSKSKNSMWKLNFEGGQFMKRRRKSLNSHCCNLISSPINRRSLSPFVTWSEKWNTDSNSSPHCALVCPFCVFVWVLQADFLTRYQHEFYRAKGKKNLWGPYGWSGDLSCRPWHH